MFKKSKPNKIIITCKRKYLSVMNLQILFGVQRHWGFILDKKKSSWNSQKKTFSNYLVRILSLGPKVRGQDNTRQEMHYFILEI